MTNSNGFCKYTYYKNYLRNPFTLPVLQLTLKRKIWSCSDIQLDSKFQDPFRRHFLFIDHFFRQPHESNQAIIAYPLKR